MRSHLAALFAVAATGVAGLVPQLRPQLRSDPLPARSLPCKSASCQQRRLGVAPVASSSHDAGLTRASCQQRRLGAAPVASGSRDAGNWVLDPHRWMQLTIISGLALLSDWACFATVAVPSEWMMVEVRQQPTACHQWQQQSMWRMPTRG